MPATKNKKVSPPKRGKRPSSTKSTKQNEEKAAANRQLAAIILFLPFRSFLYVFRLLTEEACGVFYGLSVLAFSASRHLYGR